MIPFTTLLTQPKHAWGDLSASVDRHPRAFVPLWLALPLIPAICLFIGTTQVGWRLPGNDQTQYLSASSGALLALWCYLGFLCGVVIMACLVRWVLFRTESRPDIGRSMAFTTTIAVPLMLAGVVALVPSRWRCCSPPRWPRPARPSCCSAGCRCSCTCASARRCSMPAASSASASWRY